jgi:hypothetical protein
MREDIRLDAMESFRACGAQEVITGEGITYSAEWRIPKENMDEFLEGMFAEYAGRIKERLFKEGISRQRSKKLVDALKVVRNSVGDLKKGFARSVDPARWVEQVQAYIDEALE